MMQFDLPKEKSSIIKVIGVGGGGSNAVNHMFRLGIKGVDFVVCNTDSQSLDMSPVPFKVQLGASLTEGRGAGSLPEVGKNAAIETIDEIRSILGNNTKMVFITAGMGGGTGTGAAPVIAALAKEMGILTVGIVTIPFSVEGKRRRQQAEAGVDQLKKSVDTLLVISNDKLREIYGASKVTEAFSHADDVLTTAARGIAEIITTTMHINTDFADITTVMKDSGVAIMGSAKATGENRAIKAIEQALSSPLLNDNNISGARYVLVNITCGKDEITMDELGDITDYIQDAAGQTAELIKGYGIDDSLEDAVNVTIIATGFNTRIDTGAEIQQKPERVVKDLYKSSPAQREVPIAPSVAENTQVPIAEEQEIESVSLSLGVSANEVSSEEESKEGIEALPEMILIHREPEKQVSFEFEIGNVEEENTERETERERVRDEQIAPEPEMKIQEEEIQRNPEPTPAPVKAVEDISVEEQLRKARERIESMRSLSSKIKSPGGINDLEKEPAYRRKNIKLSSIPHSSESEVSRFTLSGEEENKGSIRQNNSFLHDNVD